jgi:hypothetical protein
MSLPQDWDGIVELRMRAWESEVHRRQLRRQIPRQRLVWRRWAGAGLMRLGGWLTQWGAQMAEECSRRVTVAG